MQKKSLGHQRLTTYFMSQIPVKHVSNPGSGMSQIPVKHVSNPGKTCLKSR
jgi:hypothetical protein